MSVIVCGSRRWPQDKLWFITAKMIELIPRSTLIITGGARGVDAHAHAEAVRLGYATKLMAADWDRHGKRAGFVRNIAMLNEGPKRVLAFHWGASNGTAHTIREAIKRGIPVDVFTEEHLRPDFGDLDTDDDPVSSW